MNILVTGGGGFIGSHTCLALLEKGHKVNVIDSFVNSSEESLKRVIEIHKKKKCLSSADLSIYKGNLCDKSFIKKFFDEINKNNQIIDGVIHFAGLKSVSESFERPFAYWETNVLGTINLIEVMDLYDCRNLVFSSSASIYSKTNTFLSEHSPIDSNSPYGDTKISVERFLKDISSSPKSKWKISSLRYFNPIGAHNSGLIGEDPLGQPNNIFPLILNAAIGIQKEIKIYGNDWQTKDGTPIRDYIHVMDLAELHIDIFEYIFSNEPIFISLNLGTGLGTSVLELIKTFEKVNQIKIPYVFTKKRKGDVPYLVADNSLLKSIIKRNFYRNISEMCLDGWKWKRLNPNGY